MMKLNIRHIALLATVLLAFSCQKNPLPPTTGLPIVLSAHEAGTTPLNKGAFSATKALLDGESFKAVGNELRIYDYYTKGATSTVATGYYIDGATVQSTGSAWPFTNNERYEWTPDGVHKFFGWLVKDNNENPALEASTFFGDGFGFNTDPQNPVLTIPATTINQSSAQFDFMYSNIAERDLNVEDPYFGEVPLEFKHLFTAFNLTADNQSTNIIKLKSVIVSGLKNSRTAVIDYSGTQPTVTYTSVGCSNEQFEFDTKVGNEGITLTKNPISVSNGFHIMWPHTKADFKDTDILPKSIISVVYDYIETDDNGNVTLIKENESKDIKLENVSDWEAGKKHSLNLQFKDKEIVLQCSVQDWIPKEEVIDFTEQVSGSLPLTWDPDSVQPDGIILSEGKVILYSSSDKIAKCRFRFETPRGATWTASLISIEGHQDAFMIVDGYKYGAVGIDSEIWIKVTNVDPISPRHACKLILTIQTVDGRTIPVKNMMPDGTPSNITEYTIIQNLVNG